MSTDDQIRAGSEVKPDWVFQIGRVAVNFQHLEMAFKLVFFTLLNPKDQWVGQAIATELPFGKLVKVTGELLRQRFGSNDQIFALYGEIAGIAGQLEQERNQVIHSYWAIGEREMDITRFKTVNNNKNQGVKLQSIESATPSIKSLADKLRDLGKRLPEEVLVKISERVAPDRAEDPSES